MAIRIRIQCIVKPDRNNQYRHITHIGGIRSDNVRWQRTEEMAIQDIKAGVYQYYVSERGNTVDVEIAKHNGREYLKTKPDGITPDNLLSLPECASL